MPDVNLGDWPRPLVIVDVETNGLDRKRHRAVEVAWWNLHTGERGEFVPIHNVSKVLARADIRALQLNRYIDRLAEAPQDIDYVELNRLHDQLVDATLVGSNPGFDVAFLAAMFRRGGRLNVEPWHYRLFDVVPYAAGALGWDNLMGLWALCGRLDVDPPDHSAATDVTATGQCLLTLLARRDGRMKVDA